MNNIAIVATLLFLVSCTEQSDRKIRLSTRPIIALMQEEVETIQIAAAQKKKVALLDFQADPSAGEPAWLHEGLKQKLIRALAQSQQLNLGPSRFVSDALSTLGLSASDVANEHTSQRLAAELNADVLMRGHFRFDAQTLHVTVELRGRQDGQVLRQFSAQSSEPDTLDALNSVIAELSLVIRGELEDKQPSAPEKRMVYADVSTTSKEAYKYFIAGVERIDQFNMPDAVPLLVKAVEIDTTFATAYHHLAHALISLGYEERARPYLEKAVKYSQDLSFRERAPILAMQAILAGEFYTAVRLYNQVIELYPEDDGVHYELGNYYFSIAHDYEKAIEKYETTIELNPKHKMAYNQLAYAYAYIGELDHAFHILERYAELAPDEPNPFDSYGEILQREGQLKESIKKYEKALSISADFWPSRDHLAVAHQDLGQVRKAEKILQETLAGSTEKRFRATTLHRLGYNELLKGNLARAEEYIQRAVQEGPDDAGYKILLLYLNPESDEHRQYFREILGKAIDEFGRGGFNGNRLLHLASWALHFNVGIDLADDLLGKSIASSDDPISRRTALAFKLIYDLQSGRSTAEAEKLFVQVADPESYQYAGPAPWGQYWRHYFNALRIGNENGFAIRDWAAGLYDFANDANNPHFQINGTIAMAAAEHLAGNLDIAEQMVSKIGIPCEGNWKIIGPFDMQRGFHQQFWPEKKAVDRWIADEKYAPEIVARRDELFDGYVDLKQIAGTSMNQALYALLEINSKMFRTVQLRFGMNGRLKAWLNDELVMMKNVRGDALIDNYITTAKLRIGANYLLVRIDNVIGEMGFYFRLTNLDGAAVDEVQFCPPVLVAQSTHPMHNGS
ncbi:tetratricopeptide repeat protein [candidate division KSB1 bacterium]|nr:tetratricopeptide repeat protein [candidate division KSB1 bacterium]